jgi:hypothetical protein
MYSAASEPRLRQPTVSQVACSALGSPSAWSISSGTACMQHPVQSRHSRQHQQAGIWKGQEDRLISWAAAAAAAAVTMALQPNGLRCRPSNWAGCCSRCASS